MPRRRRPPAPEKYMMRARLMKMYRLHQPTGLTYPLRDRGRARREPGSYRADAPAGHGRTGDCQQHAATSNPRSGIFRMRNSPRRHTQDGNAA